MHDAPPAPATTPLRAGTRGSPLARVQTGMVMRALRAARDPDQLLVEEHIIRTTGDAVQDRPLAEIGGKGLFSKEIHEALADRRIDFAVHSLKDLETALPPGIVLACCLSREDPRDVLLLPHPVPATADPLAALKPGATVGTTSERRRAQLLHARPDLRTTLMRGNVQTRLDKLAAGACDASLLALAGLRRLGIDPPHLPFEPDHMVPAAGQGIVGITARDDDPDLLALLAAIDDPQASAAATAERALLEALDGSCRTPIGAHARHLPGARLHLTGLVARGDGTFLLKRSVEGPATNAHALGAALGAELRADSPADLFA